MIELEPETVRALVERVVAAEADRPVALALGLNADGFTYTLAAAAPPRVQIAPNFESFVADEQFLMPIG